MADSLPSRRGAADAPASVSQVRGLARLALLAQFRRDPVGCLNRNLLRYGRAIELAGFRGRRDGAAETLVLIGPAYNRQVLLDIERLRPTGIWPVIAPPGSAQENLRRTYLTTFGAEHESLAMPVIQHLARGRVDRQFEGARAIALAEIGGWPVDRPFDLYVAARRLSQHYAFTLLFGDAEADSVRALGDLIVRHHAANWSAGAQWLRLPLPGTPYRRALDNAEALQAFVLAWAEKERACPHAPNLRTLMAAATDGAGCPLSDKRVAAHLAGLVLASYETTAVTLTWTLFLLTQHPQVLADLTDELTAMPAAETVDLDTLSRQPLLDAVIKETLRLIAPVPMLGFKTVGDYAIAGRALAPNALIVVSPHLTHRLPEIYAAPDCFRPARWASINPSAYEYLPFSGGPRRCPGYWFALNNLKLALALILTRFRPALAEGARIDRAYAAITLPKHGVPMRLVPQDRRFAVSPGRGSMFDMFRREETPRPH